MAEAEERFARLLIILGAFWAAAELLCAVPLPVCADLARLGAADLFIEAAGAFAPVRMGLALIVEVRPLLVLAWATGLTIEIAFAFRDGAAFVAPFRGAAGAALGLGVFFDFAGIDVTP